MDYILTIRFPVEAMDDVDARAKARSITNKISNEFTHIEAATKLQEVFEDKSPRGISL